MGEDLPKQFTPGSSAGEPGSLPPDYSTRAPTGERRGTADPGNPVRRTLEFVGIVVSAVILAYLLQAFLIKPFKIPSGSMEPTLVPGDRVLVNRLAYRFGSPERGDIIVFRSPDDPNVDYIKRVIAVSGDWLEIKGEDVYVNGELLNEDYVQNSDARSFRRQIVPDGLVFVMGDNRPDSQDSRYWRPPWISEEDIIGEAFIIYWPLSRLGRLG